MINKMIRHVLPVSSTCTRIREKIVQLGHGLSHTFFVYWEKIKNIKLLGGNHSGKFIIKTHSEKVSKWL